MSSRKIPLIRLGENSTSDEYFFQGGLPNHAGLQRFKLEAVSENCEPFVKIEVVTVPESPRHGADWLTGH
ncbi:hypothetical protein JTL50_35465, partial [Pseudomonas aeruginosa]|nr:hypothetical protein [Pseudomonas aeruginosa]